MAETATMTLTEFLLARIAEADLFWETVGDMGQAHPDQVKRYRAECEAKRAIVTLCGAANAPVDCHIVLSLMTLPYADHPDYRNKWKP